MNKIELARKYCEQYGTTLPEAWEGLKVIRHPWHQPAYMVAYPMTYQMFVDRVIEIAEDKPEHERAERLGYMKPYVTELKIPKYLYEAWDARDKARDAKNKAWETKNKAKDAYYKAWDAYYKAWDAYYKAIERWQKANKNKIEQAHAKECPDCGWDGNRLPQFD